MTTLTFTSSGLTRRAQDTLLWIIAIVHVLALASLLVALGSLSPAHAEDATCGGVNLLDAMKVEKPALYQQIAADGEKIANGKGIFWKIEKPGIPASYLLGTMHVTDPRVLQMPPGAADARKQAKTIVVESDEVLDDKKALADLLTHPDLTMFTDGTSIDKLLSKDDLAVLEAGLKQRGIPMAAVSRMKPWMLMAAVSLPSCENARKAGATAFLDKQIALDAAAQGQTVKGLETYAEQLSAMAAIPMDMHMKSLVQTIRLGSKLNDVFETMTELYLSGDTGLTIPALKAAVPDDSDNAGYADFEQLVVTKRNHTMAERAAPILADGGVFVAVGALHLPGQEGLVELFRKQGFTVTRVN